MTATPAMTEPYYQVYLAHPQVLFFGLNSIYREIIRSFGLIIAPTIGRKCLQTP